jgi:sulfur carrier protein ThiS
MPITIVPIGIVRLFVPEKSLPYEPELTVRQLIERLDLPPALNACGFVNGKRMNLNASVQDGDTIRVVSLMMGG